MTQINWRRAQTRLLAAGYSVGQIDGAGGRMTYTALFAYEAGRQPDAVLRAIGTAAATYLPKYGVSDTAERLSGFLGNTDNESGHYTRFEENLHYSAKRLLQIWPSRFPTLASAVPYAWDPTDPDREDIALADLVYGTRMGNQLNGTNDDDGWENRGRGMLQHTGEQEYVQLKARVGLDPDDVADPAKSVLAACDFWQRRSVNGFYDRGDLTGGRRAVNGGTIGLAETNAGISKAMRILA
jgi:putative chitinase